MAEDVHVSQASASSVGVLALDIGGANLKAADGRGWCHVEPFAMWREQARLAEVLKGILAVRPDCGRVVATMTGEIADCFSSRAEGVQFILAALEEACLGREVLVYLVDGTLVSPAVAGKRFHQAAASNWHAVASLAARLVAPAAGLLVDIGSTTIDLVPISEGQPCPVGCDDVSRMAAGELIYTGVERTPIATLVQELPWRGRLHPVARERFADTQDAWLLLGLPLVATTETADGRPLDPPSAAARLARMLLIDAEDFTADDALLAADFVAEAQARLVARAMQQVAATIGQRPEVVVLSGHGDVLARRSLQRLNWTDCDVVSLHERVGLAASRVGPAYALAELAGGGGG
jgi:probable H4MPT-linked C1 transfer pathway protein